jgi:hypothetical protein
MANNLYTNYANLMLGNGTHALPDWDTDTIKLILFDAADYTPNLATHQDLADVPSGARVAVATIASPTISGGKVDASDVTAAAVSGDQSEGVIYYKHTGTESTSPLMVLLDTFSAGMPVTPNGGDIDFVFNASGLLGLVL